NTWVPFGKLGYNVGLSSDKNCLPLGSCTNSRPLFEFLPSPRTAGPPSCPSVPCAYLGTFHLPNLFFLPPNLCHAQLTPPITPLTPDPIPSTILLDTALKPSLTLLAPSTIPFFILPGIPVTVLTILETRSLTVSRIPLNIFETLVLKPLNLVFAVLTRFEIGLIVTFLIPFQTLPDNDLIPSIVLLILFFTKLPIDLMMLVNIVLIPFHMPDITDFKPLANNLPAFKIRPKKLNWIKFHTNLTAPESIVLIPSHMPDQLPVNTLANNLINPVMTCSAPSITPLILPHTVLTIKSIALKVTLKIPLMIGSEILTMETIALIIGSITNQIA